MISYLSMVFSFLDKVLSYELINGVTIYIIFFYNMLLIAFWLAFTRRG